MPKAKPKPGTIQKPRANGASKSKTVRPRKARLPPEMRGQSQVPKTLIRSLAHSLLSMRSSEVQAIYDDDSHPSIYRLLAGLILKATSTADVNRSRFLMEVIEEDKDLHKYLEVVNASTREQIIDKARKALAQLGGSIETVATEAIRPVEPETNVRSVDIDGDKPNDRELD